MREKRNEEMKNENFCNFLIFFCANKSQGYTRVFRERMEETRLAFLTIDVLSSNTDGLIVSHWEIED